MRLNASRLVAKLKRVCVHHAQVMVGTAERSNAQSMISTRSKTAANQPTSQQEVLFYDTPFVDL